jgi:threonine/homoserine/homoserine lactone efflux protein
MEAFGFYSLTGLLLGLSAALTPGPLFLLVVSQSLRRGTLAGMQVAVAPLLTDLPIFGASLWLAQRLSQQPFWLALISLAGGLFLCYLAWETFRSHPPSARPSAKTLAPWLQGAITNGLNPHPYFFWFTVGGPLALRGFAASPAAGAGFIGGMYLTLVGGKLLLAWMAGHGRQFLLDRPAFQWLVRALGAALLVYALWFLHHGCKLAGVL